MEVRFRLRVVQEMLGIWTRVMDSVSAGTSLREKVPDEFGCELTPATSNAATPRDAANWSSISRPPALSMSRACSTRRRASAPGGRQPAPPAREQLGQASNERILVPLACS
eukprot:1282140-Prymnesium_polylepis.4